MKEDEGRVKSPLERRFTLQGLKNGLVVREINRSGIESKMRSEDWAVLKLGLRVKSLSLIR